MGDKYKGRRHKKVKPPKIVKTEVPDKLTPAPTGGKKSWLRKLGKKKRRKT